MHSGRDSGAPIHKAEKGGMEEEKVGKITIGKKRCKNGNLGFNFEDKIYTFLWLS